jgi:fumarate reductase (CoM/CoB) subunit A
MQRKGVRILEDVFITELIKKGERIIGATGILWDTGTFIAISTKAIIMATGGHEALYSFRTTTPRATGDGIAMALRAGAEVMDMEFMQFNPYTIIYPQGAAGVLVPVNSYIMTRGGKYRNRKGEAFIDKWDPIRKEATTRDVKARAMFAEMTGGRGSKHGGVYLDLSGLQDLDGRSPKEILEDQGGMHHKYLTQFGVDILTDELEVAPAAHFGCEPNGIICCWRSLRGGAWSKPAGWGFYARNIRIWQDCRGDGGLFFCFKCERYTFRKKYQKRERNGTKLFELREWKDKDK